MLEPVTVLVADDHPVYRDGLRSLIDSMDDAVVVGEAATGEEAIERALDLQPDVVVMDLRMPGTNGIEATRAVTQASPHTRVLVLTMFKDDESVFAAMRAGAGGYLLKEAARGEIERAIRAVAAGEAIFGPTVARRVLDYFAAGPHAVPPTFPQLTSRERELLDLVAQGRNNAQIAARLGVRPKTVRNHISNIFTKLQVADRAEAIVRAREAGMGRGPSDSSS